MKSTLFLITALSAALASAQAPAVINAQQTINTVKASKSFQDGLVLLDFNKTVAAKAQVIVIAPVQGVLRFVPFAVQNAKKGDTITFVWGGSGHNVIQGSALNICNATKSLTAFKSSGPLSNITTTYSITVEQDTAPIWFYCAPHCKLGMYGGINLKTVSDAEVSKDGNVSSSSGTISAAAWMKNNQDKIPALKDSILAAEQATLGDTEAANWGSTFSMSKDDVSPDTALDFATNILETRVGIAARNKLVLANAQSPSSSAASVQMPATVASIQMSATSDNAYGPAMASPAPTLAAPSAGFAILPPVTLAISLIVLALF